MAREYAQIRLSIWNDDAFRQLSPSAQWLYFLLLTHPTLTSAGVGDWRPNRLAALARGHDVAAVVEAGAELARRLYIVVDTDTEEYLVRSFHRNDDLLKMPNMATAAARAAAEVASSGIRGVIVFELNRLKRERPGMKGWGSQELLELMGGEAIDPSVYPCWNPSVKGSGNPSVNPSPNPSVKGSVDPSGNPSDNPSVKGEGIPSGNPSVNPSPSTATATATHNTQPSTGGGKVVGNVTGGAEPSFSPPQISQTIPDAWLDDPGAARCATHIGDPFPPPCGGCADARKTAERASWARATERRQRAEARRTAIDGCDLCDDGGWILDVHPVTRCTHDADRNSEIVLKQVADAEAREQVAQEAREIARQAAAAARERRTA